MAMIYLLLVPCDGSTKVQITSQAEAKTCGHCTVTNGMISYVVFSSLDVIQLAKAIVVLLMCLFVCLFVSFQTLMKLPDCLPDCWIRAMLSYRVRGREGKDKIWTFICSIWWHCSEVWTGVHPFHFSTSGTAEEKTHIQDLFIKIQIRNSSKHAHVYLNQLFVPEQQHRAFYLGSIQLFHLVTLIFWGGICWLFNFSYSTMKINSGVLWNAESCSGEWWRKRAHAGLKWPPSAEDWGDL